MLLYPLALLSLGLVSACGAKSSCRACRAWIRIPARLLLALLALLLSFAGGYGLWYLYRPHPPPLDRQLFQGVRYLRELRASPCPNVVHVITVDLTQPGIRFLVTPPDSSDAHPLKARTTSAFLREFDLQVAVNASFFFPWHSNGPLDYYPREADPVSVLGLAVSQGRQYSATEKGYPSLLLTCDNRAAVGTTLPNVHNAVSGKPLLAKGAIPAGNLDAGPAGERHPRTAVALDASGTKLLLVVVDGRQPNYSEGATLEELADIVRSHGADVALNLDGGGSTTLVSADRHGEPVLLNSPIHGRIPPGQERPVANHLGIYARPE